MERLEEPRGKRLRSGVELLVALKAEGDGGGWWEELGEGGERLS